MSCHPSQGGGSHLAADQVDVQYQFASSTSGKVLLQASILCAGLSELPATWCRAVRRRSNLLSCSRFGTISPQWLVTWQAYWNLNVNFGLSLLPAVGYACNQAIVLHVLIGQHDRKFVNNSLCNALLFYVAVYFFTRVDSCRVAMFRVQFTAVNSTDKSTRHLVNLFATEVMPIIRLRSQLPVLITPTGFYDKFYGSIFHSSVIFNIYGMW